MTEQPGVQVEPVTEQSPVTIRKVWPAEVALPDGTVLRDALVVVTQQRVYVWRASAAGQIELVWNSGWTWEGSVLTKEHLLVASPLRVATEAGVMSVNRGRGCGCGNPLGRWQPWQPEMRASE